MSGPKHLVTCALVALSLLWNGAVQAAPDTPPAAKLALELRRGISIDRQFRTIPPEPAMRFTKEDVQLIKSMGFGFIKVLVNPEPLMAGNHLDSAKADYLRELVNLVIQEDLPIVVCIHPEWEFKKAILSDPKKFVRFLGFLEDIARYLAKEWSPDQLALQLMTEPGANAMNWNDLQPQMWRAVRRVMPHHTLILAGDQVGTIDGLVATIPVNDANVMYSFTYYDPFTFTLQGGEWLSPKLWSYLGAIPYPSTPELLAERKQAILEKIPADPPDWRPSADGMLTEYGTACWNRDKIAAAVRKLTEWNKAHGGGLRIWCAEFGCYQRTVEPEDRYRYLKDVRDVFEENGIQWAYWSYNETLTIMKPGRQPFGPASAQKPDERLLHILFGTDGK